MILTGQEILKQVQSTHIKIEPFDAKRITTNAYDLKLGTKLLKYTDETLDPKKEPNFEIIELTEEGYTLKPGEFLLATTAESVGSDAYVCKLHSKSGTARQGLFVHITADLIELGTFGTLSLQLYATLPVTIYPNQDIAQITFWQPKGEISSKQSLYAGTEEPKAYRIKDFA